MTLLKFKDITKMKKEERLSKMKELRLELIRSGVTANKQNAKTKEIKKAISRILTFNNQELLSKK